MRIGEWLTWWISELHDMGRIFRITSFKQLEHLRDQTNPRLLRQEIYDLLAHLFSLPGATTDRSEDVFQTLITHPIPEKGDGIPVTLSFDLTRGVLLHLICDGSDTCCVCPEKGR